MATSKSFRSEHDVSAPIKIRTKQRQEKSVAGADSHFFRACRVVFFGSAKFVPTALSSPKIQSSSGKPLGTGVSLRFSERFSTAEALKSKCPNDTGEWSYLLQEESIRGGRYDSEQGKTVTITLFTFLTAHFFTQQLR
jgi:hypothetical protein